MSNDSGKLDCTYVDGIASSQAIDTAGEIVDLNGLDCSSLIGAALNWEHLSALPGQLVGKVLEYKKIFSEKDCENDRQKYFWNKCKTPYLYVLGRLFDDKKESSKECAALFLDDAEHPTEKPMVGFSIEGSKVEKQGMTVTKSIARKLTITNANANKQCVAELVPASKTNKESNSDSIFKSEVTHTIELLVKSEELKKVEFMSDLRKAVPKNWMASRGKGKTGAVINLEHPEHGTITVHHNPETKKFEVKHAGAHANLKGQKNTGFDTARGAVDHAKNYANSIIAGTTSGNKMRNFASASMENPKIGFGPKKVTKTENMGKALDAGSGMASPANLSGGAVLNKKSKHSDRAKEEYEKWGKKEEFESFMSKSMPHLTKGEIKAIGQVLCLNKSLKAEKKLAKMMRDEGQDSWVNKKEK